MELRSDLFCSSSRSTESDVVENECRFAAKAPTKSARAGLGGPWIGSHVATPPNASEPSQSSTKRSRTYTPFTTGVFETNAPGGPARLCSCLHAAVYPSFQGMQCITAGGFSVMLATSPQRHAQPHNRSARKTSKAESRQNPL